MKVLTPGHRYELANFEKPEGEGQILQFIEKRVDTTDTSVTPGVLRTVHDGTTNEEVLRMLIDRVQYLGAKLPSRENSIALTKLEEALMWLEKRTRDRQSRGVEGTRQP